MYTRFVLKAGFQKLHGKLLRAELEAVDEVVRDSRVREITQTEGAALVRERTAQKARRMVGISRKSIVNKDRIRSDSPGVSCVDNRAEYVDDKPATPMAPRVLYESLRHRPSYQDLTHSEVRRMQEVEEKKKMFERKLRWLRGSGVVDPVRVVNKEMRKSRKQKYIEWTTRLNLDGGPEREIREQIDPQMSRKIEKVEFKMERDTAVSKLRAAIRVQKLANSQVLNTPTPNIGDVITDPLKRHLKRRTVRTTILMQQYLEELLSCNSAQILLDHLGGAGISVEKIAAPSTRGIHTVFVRVTGHHDHNWIQERLNILAPKLRSQLAIKVNYGYTPELKFKILHDIDKFNKSRLMNLAETAKNDLDKQIHKNFLKQMNWK